MTVLAIVSLTSAVRAETITVAAAASLTNAMNEIGRAFSRANPGISVRFTFGSSGALQQQIYQGAPIDVFASASPREMDALQKSGDILPQSRTDFAGNRLVLIAPGDSVLRSWDDLTSSAVRRVAVSDPASVPSGRYSKETLIKRNLWQVVLPKAVFGQNVRQTLLYVAGGDAQAGIVFATDALIEKRVKVIAQASSGRDHTPIIYPAAVVRRSQHRDSAERFIVFLKGQAAQKLLRHSGFSEVMAAKKE